MEDLKSFSECSERGRFCPPPCPLMYSNIPRPTMDYQSFSYHMKIVSLPPAFAWLRLVMYIFWKGYICQCFQVKINNSLSLEIDIIWSHTNEGKFLMHMPLIHMGGARGHICIPWAYVLQTTILVFFVVRISFGQNQNLPHNVPYRKRTSSSMPHGVSNLCCWAGLPSPQNPK